MNNYTVFSYLVLGTIVIAYALYTRLNKKGPVRPPPTSRPAPQPRKEKVKKQRERKAPDVSETTKTPAITTAYKPVEYSSDDVDNKDFARRLQEAQIGTKVKVGKKAEEKKLKSVKQSRAQEKSANAKKLSAPSSTAGIDADDDQSAEPSPVIQPLDTSGVSDMLEAQAPGPAVLRLTDTEKVRQPKESKPAKVVDEVVTKKKRQNKKKAEAQKQLREEEEKERKAKLEAHRRSVRIAEGRPAPDGSSFLASQSNKAWKANPATATPTAPLDTFEQESTKQSSNTSDAEWIKTLPSEEEQIERVLKEAAEDEWATVESKASKRKQRKDGDGRDSDVPAPSNSNGSKLASEKSAYAALDTNGLGEENSDSGDNHMGTQSEGKLAVKSKMAPVETEWDI